MASLVAKNYSDALFELAEETNCLDDVKSDLVVIADVLKTNNEFKKVMCHPSIEKKDKKEVLIKVFDGMNHLVSNFVQLLVDKNRFMAFNDICEEFIKHYNEVKNIEIAKVYSAKALSSDELEKIKAMLEKKTNKTIELKTYVDESLIAGVKVKIKDEVLDNTVINRLTKMKDIINKVNI